MSNEQLLEKLRPLYTTISMEKLEAIMNLFFNNSKRYPIAQELKEHRERTGVIMGRRQVERVIKALEKMGHKLAPIKHKKMTKQEYISEVMQTSTSSEKIVKKVYENLVSTKRKAHHLLAKSLSTDTYECNVATVKNIAMLFIELGIKAKPVKVQTKSGPKSSFKIGAISLDEGVIRWNPSHKLMPEAFKHLDNAF